MYKEYVFSFWNTFYILQQHDHHCICGWNSFASRLIEVWIDGMFSCFFNPNVFLWISWNRFQLWTEKWWNCPSLVRMVVNPCKSAWEKDKSNTHKCFYSIPSIKQHNNKQRIISIFQPDLFPYVIWCKEFKWIKLIHCVLVTSGII